jgi:signal transduction histidine kinase
MYLYDNLSKISFLKNKYALKFLFVAFIGIHLPLIGIIFFVLLQQDKLSKFSIVIFTLIMTLLATTVTLVVLRGLILPIGNASKALATYRKSRLVPSLPTHFNDEAGLLLRNIQHSIEENENLLQAKQDLLYLLSHDLKNSTTNPYNLANLIIQENPSDAVKEYAQLIMDASGQQLSLIQNFILLIKQEEEISKTLQKEENANLQLVTQEVCQKLLPKLQSKNITLELDLMPNNFEIKIHKDLLHSVLLNLLDNAIKFSYKDSSINIITKNESSNLIIEIRDQGVGFKPTNTDKLFLQFTPMSKTGTSNEPSTGIGLYLCKKIIEKNNASITAFSNGLEKGASFTIVFPKESFKVHQANSEQMNMLT